MTILSNTDLKAVVYDVYGTLAEIKDRRNSPFKKLLRYGQEFGRTPRRDDAANVMSHPGGVREAASRLGIEVPEELLRELEADLLMELNSISLFEDVDDTLMILKNQGMKVGLCSNLAERYAGPILRLLSVQLDCYAWSFMVGAIKPSPAIYKYVLSALDCEPRQVLFIGDTQEADVDAPIKIGMQACLIDRAKSMRLNDALGFFDADCVAPNLLDTRLRGEILDFDLCSHREPIRHICSTRNHVRAALAIRLQPPTGLPLIGKNSHPHVCIT